MSKNVKEPLFEFYVLNYDPNRKKVYLYNIFNNIRVQECTEREVRKYIRRPSAYVHTAGSGEKTFGFEGFCLELASIIKWQEWSRVEYEISVGAPFEDDISRMEKWDCWMQCEKNIGIIAREVIRKYREYMRS